MSYKFVNENDTAAFEQFVRAHGGIYMQSEKWIKVKLEWHSRLISGFDENNNRVLSAIIMERHIPAAGKIWYSPAGPVCDYSNAALLREFTAFMKRELKKEGATAYIIDPCVELRVNGERNEQGAAVHKCLVENGFKLNTDASKCLYKSPVQLILPLKTPQGEQKTPQQLLKSFEKGVRYSVRAGDNRGLVCRTYTIEDIDKNPKIMQDFLDVMHDTSERSDFVERGGEYCERLMRVFGPEQMDLMLVYYDKKKDAQLEAERLARKEELQKALETAPEKKQRGIREEIESIERQSAHYDERRRETQELGEDEICVSGGITVHYNSVSSCLFGGSKNLLRNNLRSSHYFNFRRICHSIELENSFHDLGYVLLSAVPPEADGTLGVCVPNKDFEGICAFKKSFGSDYIEYIGEYALVGNKALFFSYSHLLEKARSVQSVVNRVLRGRL